VTPLLAFEAVRGAHGIRFAGPMAVLLADETLRRAYLCV